MRIVCKLINQRQRIEVVTAIIEKPDFRHSAPYVVCGATVAFAIGPNAGA